MQSVLAPVLATELSPTLTEHGIDRIWFSRKRRSLRSSFKKSVEVNPISFREFTLKRAGQLKLIQSPINVEPVVSADSPLDMVSPKPVELYTKELYPKGKTSFKVWKLVEELAESEKTYVSLLQLLLKYYIVPLLDEIKQPCPIPLKLMGALTKQIVELHYTFVNALEKECFKGQNRFDLCSILESLKTMSTNFYLYIDYCSLYKDVLDLYRGGGSSTSLISIPWLRGLSHFLEATQPVSRKHDLSFISLIQRPTARYGKYRLFLEAIFKQLLNDISSPMFQSAQDTLDLTKNRLLIIDRDSLHFEESPYFKSMNEMIDILSLSIPLTFFSTPQLAGCLNGVWVEGDKIKSTNFFVVAFKSHLLLCDNNVTRKTHQAPKFLIPLSRCQLIAGKSDWNGGLFSQYPNAFKIVFEKNYCQYELLFAAIDKQEYEVWNAQLNTLINFVNGPYNMDFSSLDEGVDLITVCPDALSPLNISLDLQDSKKKADCYFQTSKVIIIRNHIYKQPETGEPDFYDHIIVLTRFERIRSEKRLKSVWSIELPRITTEKRVKKRRRSSIRQLFRSSSKLIPELLNRSESSASVATCVGPEDYEMMYTARTHVSSATSPPRLSRASTIKSGFQRLFSIKN